MKAIRATLDCSAFFQSHEVIGSSLLFVHDNLNASIWLIDFAKTVELPQNVAIDHNSAWTVGNHEDGYLIGINNMIDIFTELLPENQTKITDSVDKTTAIGDSPKYSTETTTRVEISTALQQLTLESRVDTESPDSAQRSSTSTTPSIVKTNSSQRIIILDNSTLVGDGLREDT